MSQGEVFAAIVTVQAMDCGLDDSVIVGVFSEEARAKQEANDYAAKLRDVITDSKIMDFVITYVLDEVHETPEDHWAYEQALEEQEDE